MDGDDKHNRETQPLPPPVQSDDRVQFEDRAQPGQRTRGRHPGVVRNRDTGMSDDIPRGYDQRVDPDDLTFVRRKRKNGKMVDVFVREFDAPPEIDPGMSDAQSRSRYGLSVEATLPPAPKGLTFWRFVMILTLVAMGTGGGVAGGIGCKGKQDIRYIPIPGQHPSMRVLEAFLDSNTIDYLDDKEIGLARAAIRAEREIIDDERDVFRVIREKYPDEIDEWESRRED